MSEQEVAQVLGAGIAVINKIQTTVDNGARVTIDFGSDSSHLITKLLSHKLADDETLYVSFVRTE